MFIWYDHIAYTYDIYIYIALYNMKLNAYIIYLTHDVQKYQSLERECTVGNAMCIKNQPNVL